MDNPGSAPSSYRRSHQAAIAAARQRVLASYNSAVDTLKQGKDDNFYPAPMPAELPSDWAADAINDTAELGEILTIEHDAIVKKSPHAVATEDMRQAAIAQEAAVATATPASPTSLKSAPINQSAVTSEWREYHSAWQNYYQNYYNEYYSQAAQTYLETEKLKTARVASGEKQRRRHAKRMLPVAIIVTLIITFLFLQYNRMIFAPIMAYVSPDSGDVSSSIESVDPSVNAQVSADPRLIIPKLNIDVPVAFGINYTEVMSAMNHGVAQFIIPGASAMPGQVGNLVISGHSAGDIYSSNPYKFIFSGLERLENGDLIYVNYNSVRYTYQMVRREVVEPTNVQALVYETSKPMLTLITCTPLGTSRFRLLITAEQISPTYTETPTAPSVAPDDASYAMPANEPTLLESIFGQ